ncbi:MAG TPA: class I SAM-dependent methyltransferase [Gemmataceae bacterium]|nr:class I SAM-dependent methyltransferase [Gemmataceae bacterium]
MTVDATVWKERDVASAFLNERSLHIPERQRQLEVMLRVIRFAPRKPARILDLGCGDAILLATALEAWPEAHGLAVDFSPLMLEQAQVRLARFDGRAGTVEADLGSPGWLDAVTGTTPFDAVLSGLAIHHLPHERKRALYHEIFDLLSPGGVFLNLEHVASPTPVVEAMFDDFMTEHLYRRRGERGEDVTPDQVRRDFMERPDRAANILASVEEQCQWLREIGFQDVDCFWKYFELAIFGGFRK